MSLWIVARLKMRSTADDGRQAAFVAGGVYRPQLHLAGGKGSTSFIVHKIDGRAEVFPGEEAACEGWLLAPEALERPLGIGTMFVLSEGGREVGSGTVTGLTEVAL